MKNFYKEDYDEIEGAIYFLADCIREEKRTSKPLMLHSLRVGLRLMEDGQPKDVVIAGLLHDVLEDTKCTQGELEKGFGQEAAKLVEQCSFRPEREDLLRLSNTKTYEQEWMKEFNNWEGYGKEALLIKAADILDNGFLLVQIEDSAHRKNFIWKHREFVRRFNSRLKGERIFKELKIRVAKYK